MIQPYLDKIDALSVRERMVIFIAGLAVIYLLFSFLIEPSFSKQKQLSQQIGQQQVQIKSLQEQIQTMAKLHSTNPDAANKTRLHDIQSKLVETDIKLQRLQKGLVPSNNVASLLEDVLAKDRGLQLIRLRTLPAEPLIEQPPNGATGQNIEIKNESDKNIYTHGVELTVQGGYLELLQYLSQLEKLPWRMFWGKVEMNTEAYPKVTLTLTLYTLSLDKAWLAV